MAKNSDPAAQDQETPEQKAAREEAEAKAKAEADAKAKSKASIVSLRHKTEYPSYGRAGIRMTKAAKDYRVTAEQLAALRSDPNVEVVEK